MKNKLKTTEPHSASAEVSRRQFLQEAGRLAAYTTPTMLALMYPGAHAVASGGSYEEPHQRGRGHGDGNGRRPRNGPGGWFQNRR